MKYMRYYSLPLLTLLLLNACGGSEAPEAEDTVSSPDSTQNNEVLVTKAQFETSGMALGTLQTYPFADRVEANGYLDVPPQNQAEVSTYAEGYIHRIDLLVGDQVKKGQLLVSLINPAYLQLQQDYLDTKEQLAFLEAEYERQRTLSSEKIASQKTFLKAQSDYKSAAARMQGMKKRLELLNISPARVAAGDFTATINIYAPITGNITAIHTTLGSFVSPSDVILEVINRDHEHLELTVFEQDILHIREGQTVAFRIPNAGAETYRAEIHRVGQSVDAETRTVTVHADVLEDNPRFVTGMYVEAQILTDTVSAPALPEAAIVQDQDQSYLLALIRQSDSQYVFKKQRVKTGRTANGEIELLSPQLLKPDGVVLVRGAFALIGGN